MGQPGEWDHVRDTDGEPQAAEVIETFRQLCPQLSPEFGDGAFPTFGPGARISFRGDADHLKDRNLMTSGRWLLIRKRAS